MAIQHIDIIIPSDNVEDLEYCLDSLLLNLNLDQYKFEVIIPFNNINKEEQEKFNNLINNESYKKLSISPMFFHKVVNLATCVNNGIIHSMSKRVKPSYIAFLHDDSMILKDWIESSIYAMNNNIRIIGCGSVTYNKFDDLCLSKCKNIFEKSNNDGFDLDRFDYENEQIKKCKNNIYVIRNKINSLKSNNKQYNSLLNKILEEKNLIKNTLESFSNHINSSFNKNDYYEFKNDDDQCKFNLFGVIFKSNIFETIKFDEDLISSINVENEFAKQIYNKNHTIVLNPYTYVYHKCKLLSFENRELHQIKKLKKATLENIKLKHSFNKASRKKEYVVYTCVLEDEILPDLKNYDIDYCDYVCFTTNDYTYETRDDRHPWKIINIKTIADGLNISYKSNKLKSLIKLNPHFFFNSYNVSLWIDVFKIPEFYRNVTDLIRLIKPDTTTLTLGSNNFNCSYRYILNKYKNNLIHPDEKDKIIQIYKWHRYPFDIGMIDDSLIIRKHNDIMCKIIMNKIWYYAYNIHSDVKLFFNFCFWLFKRDYQMIPLNIFYKHLSLTLKNYGDK